jgi:hypothetical protein
MPYKNSVSTLACLYTLRGEAVTRLSAGALATGGEPAIRSARLNLIAARVVLEVAQRLPVPAAIENLPGVAVQQLRRARSTLANPATLPPSFRN